MSLTYTTRRETALARVVARYADTPEEAVGRAIREANTGGPPSAPTRKVIGRRQVPAPVRSLATTYAHPRRRNVFGPALAEAERMNRPNGVTVDGRRVYPFGVTVEYGTEVTERRPEVGWSSDGTHTPPRFSTRRWWA